MDKENDDQLFGNQDVNRNLPKLLEMSRNDYETLKSLVAIIQMIQRRTSSGSKDEKSVHECIAAMRTVFRRWSITSGDEFRTIFELTAMLIGQNVKPSETGLSPFTDDATYLALLDALDDLVVACPISIYREVFRAENFKYLNGYILNVTIELATRSNHSRLRIKVMNVISRLFLKMGTGFLRDDDFRIIRSDGDDWAEPSRFIAFIMPGVIGFIWKTFLSCITDNMEPEFVISGLKLLNITLQIVFHEGQSFCGEPPATAIANQKLLLEVVFDETWLETVSERIGYVLETVTKVSLLNDHSVRSNHLKCCSSLIFNCCEEFLAKHALHLFTSIGSNMIPVEHDRPINDDFSDRFRATFYSRLVAKANKSKVDLIHLLHERICSHLKRLPSLFRNETNTGKIVTRTTLLFSLRLLAGYISTLTGDGLYDFLKLEHQKHLFFRTLVNLAEFDCAKITFKMQVVLGIEDQNLFDKHHKLVCFRNDPELKAHFVWTIHHFTLNCNLAVIPVVLDHFSDLLPSSDFDPSVLFIFNVIIHSFRRLYDLNPEILAPNAKEFINLYLEELRKLLPNNLEKKSPPDHGLLLPYNDNNSRKELEWYNRHLLQHSLLLEGLGLLYALLGPEQIQKDFFRFGFLEMVRSHSHPEPMISSVAHSCLALLARNGGYQSIRHLYLMNLHHIRTAYSIILHSSLQQLNIGGNEVFSCHFQSIKSIAISLRHLIHTVAESEPLSELNWGQIEPLNYLMEEILHLVKYFSVEPSRFCTGDLKHLLDVLYCYQKMIGNMPGVLPENKLIVNLIEGNQNSKINQVEEIISELETFTRATNLAATMNPEVDNEYNAMDDVHLNDQEQISIVQNPVIKSRIKEIFHLCPMLLSNPDIEVRLIILQMCHLAIRILAPFEDILLPYVHRLWDPLVKRLSLDLEHPTVIELAFQCILVASKHCGDFLLQRTRKEVLPAIVEFLYANLERRTFHFQAYERVQTNQSRTMAETALLSSLGQLATNIKLPAEDVWIMLPLILIYGCCKAIKPEVRQCMVGSLDALLEYDEYSLRFYVHSFLEIFYSDANLLLNHPKARAENQFQCDCHRIRCDKYPKLLEPYRKHLMLPLDQTPLLDFISTKL